MYLEHLPLVMARGSTSLVMDLAWPSCGCITVSSSSVVAGRWSSQRSPASAERERRLRADRAGPRSDGDATDAAAAFCTDVSRGSDAVGFSAGVGAGAAADSRSDSDAVDAADWLLGSGVAAPASMIWRSARNRCVCWRSCASVPRCRSNSRRNCKTEVCH